MADAVYIEPITLEFVANYSKGKTRCLVPTLGGQTGLNMAVELAEAGILMNVNVKYWEQSFLPSKKRRIVICSVT